VPPPVKKRHAARFPTVSRRLRREPLRHLGLMLGPAFVAAIAYVDPGNFATNFSAGAAFGDRLLWVVAAASLTGILIQALAAKLGLATGADMAALCRREFPAPVVWVLWLQAEAVAMATDLAEIVGGAIALSLLFGFPLPVGGLITGTISCVLLGAHSRGRRPFEGIVGGMLLAVALAFGYMLLAARADPADVARGLVPSFDGPGSVLLASSILGATVMPHVIYVHSDLAAGRYGDARGQARTRATRQRLLRAQRVDILLAMGIAGVVNAVMLVIAARLFTGTDAASSLQAVQHGIARALGGMSADCFALALLTAGLASASVGTHAGQIIMAGFLGRHIPVMIRRLITLTPPLAVLVLGLDPTSALVWSQVVLSVGILFTLVPLVMLTSRFDLMGPWVNRRLTTVAGWAMVVMIGFLNIYLLT
jgi:manganese transport protein